MASVLKGASNLWAPSAAVPYQALHNPSVYSLSVRRRKPSLPAFSHRSSKRPSSAPSSSSPFLFILASTSKLSDVEAVPLTDDLSKLPAAAGIYAIYDKAGELQYLGLTRRLSASLSNHVRDLPDLCASTKFAVITSPEKAALLDAWKEWMEEHIASAGTVPPGNIQGVTTWTERKPRATKQDIWLMPRPNMKLKITLEELIDKVIKENKVVAFIKGTRTAPQCGFSHRVLTILNEHGINYESVNVLDEEHNMGLREALKVYSQWPTIPQVYADGEFIGGADILDELATDGKIKAVFQKAA